MEESKQNGFEILNELVKGNRDIICEIFLQNALENPNDLLGFKVGMVFGLHSGNKLYMRKLADAVYKYEENHENSYFIGIY